MKIHERPVMAIRRATELAAMLCQFMVFLVFAVYCAYFPPRLEGR